jgi:putative transposon-encoded protein
MSEAMEIQTKAFQAIDRIVKGIGNSGGIYLPKEWIGKKVKVLLVEDTGKAI